MEGGSRLTSRPSRQGQKGGKGRGWPPPDEGSGAEEGDGEGVASA